MGFRIRLHEAERILEVTYPARPTEEDVNDYARKIRTYIDAFARCDWSCLVDQTDLQVMDPTQTHAIAGLNAYAQANGMRRAARVVASAVGRLQSQRVMREARLLTEFRMFDTRDEALSWLRAAPRSNPPPERDSTRRLG